METTSVYFFIKFFLFLILLFIFVVAALYVFIFLCSSATIAKAIKSESEKLSAKERREFERNAKREAEILYTEKAALLKIEHSEEIKELKKELKEK